MAKESPAKLTPLERGVFYNHAEFSLDPNSPLSIKILISEEGSYRKPFRTPIGFVLPYGASAYLKCTWPVENIKFYMDLRYRKSHGELPPSIEVNTSSQKAKRIDGQPFPFRVDGGADLTLNPTDLGQFVLRKPGVPPIIFNYTLGSRTVNK